MSDDEKSNGPRSPTRSANGNPARPDYDRTDTGGGDWATENEGENEKVREMALVSVYLHGNTC